MARVLDQLALLETHLTRVYAKVAVTSRLLLAQEAQRRADIQRTPGDRKR